MRTNEAIKEEILKINNPVTGELIGGCDIVTEMHESGDLETIIKKAAS